MTRILAITTATVVLTVAFGCASVRSNHERFQGDWRIDVQRMLEINLDMATAADENPDMIDRMHAALGKATISIGAQSLVARGFKPVDDKANYKVVSADGNSMVIESRDEGKDNVERLTVTFESDDHITITKQGEDTKMALRRKSQ